uniref:Uncharacterized protein n=2 Tax=Candidatus Kentrum sp. UNK TaxID=2126344 RepID=A0A451AAT6_9GAMM|nr:MAG: hypothetical protein BECKUNK1418G_GA0071005_103012 [Candidatus Kentron sp. UNK]
MEDMLCFALKLLNDHVEGFITPADEKRARVGWIATRIHREEEMVDVRSDPPYGPESGLLFHSKVQIRLIFLFPAHLREWVEFYKMPTLLYLFTYRKNKILGNPMPKFGPIPFGFYCYALTCSELCLVGPRRSFASVIGD